MFASFTTGARRLVTLIVARKNYRYEGEHEASSQEYRTKQEDKLFTTNMKNKSVNRVISRWIILIKLLSNKTMKNEE